MKVVLIQAKYFNIWEALGCAYIGTVAKNNFKNINIEFFQGYFDSNIEIIKACKDADIVGFSCTTPTYQHALSLAKKVKAVNSNAYNVFGGWHPSAVPSIIEESAIDCVVIGEGDLTFLDIIEGRREPIIHAESVQNFDSLPFPDRNLIKSQREIALAEKITGLRMTSFQSIRGCPRNCVFCGEHIISGKLCKKNALRVRSPENIISEINKVEKEYKLDYFKFVDPTWNISEEKVIAFCNEKLKSGNSLPWECNLHGALATKKMLQAMKEAGCQQINIGCESGSEKILKDMKKGITLEQIKNVFAWGREIGLQRRAYFLLGMPNESREDIGMTEKLIEEIDPDVLGITILCPYPGSNLYNEHCFNPIEWDKTDEYGNDFWETKYLTNKDLKYWQDYLIKKFYDKASWHNKIVLDQH